MAIDVTDPLTFALDVCSFQATPTVLHGRVGAAVEITSLSPDAFNETASAPFTQGCAGMTRFTDFTPAGKWYLLFDSPNALVGSSPGFDVYKVVVSGTGATARPAGTTPPTCTPPSAVSALAVSPPSAAVAPRGARSFTASGGSGTGYTWSLQANASGGTIAAATGAYAAGPTGNVTDVVKVTDSAAHTATASVTVTAGVSIAPPTAAVAPAGTAAFTASGGSGTGYAWSLSTNASGGTIVAATGAYTAGFVGGVTDVVEVADSLGNEASASVAVTAGGGGGGGGGTPSPSKKCGCASGGDVAWGLALALAGLLRIPLAMRRRE
jgi:hypothetical protein